jgi:ABC-type antimicrobial peptide transport system permease subunit
MNYQLAVLRDMLASFAVLGLALASLGIYGVIARLMAQRTGEFAIRLAMGAGVSDIVRLVLASGIAQALTGAVIGLTGALFVSRFLASAYPSMHMGGPGVLGATTAILLAVALLACWMPARRAGRIDATLALRAD